MFVNRHLLSAAGLGVGLSIVASTASAQAGRSGYAPYAPGAGLRDVRASVALSYHLSPKVTFTGVLSAVSLQEDAKRSPLVRDRSTVNAIVGVGYAF